MSRSRPDWPEVDSFVEPRLHFRFDPANGPRADLDAAWKLARRLELVNHRSAEAGGPADGWQTKNLNCAVICSG